MGLEWRELWMDGDLALGDRGDEKCEIWLEREGKFEWIGESWFKRKIFKLSKEVVIGMNVAICRVVVGTIGGIEVFELKNEGVGWDIGHWGDEANLEWWVEDSIDTKIERVD